MAALPRLDSNLEGVANVENNPGGGDGFWGGGGQFEGKLGPWNTLRIDAQVFPGCSDYGDPGACPVEISGMVKYKIDSQKAHGHDGHKLVANGYEPTQCTAMIRIYTPAQWQAFIRYLPKINPKVPRTRPKVDSKGKPVMTQATATVGVLAADAPFTTVVAAGAGPRVVNVGAPVQVIESYRPSYTAEHPWLAMYGITRVYINEITFPEESDGSRMIRAVKMTMWEVWDIKKPTGAAVHQTDGVVNVEASFQGAPGQGPAPGDPRGAVVHEPRRIDK